MVRLGKRVDEDFYSGIDVEWNGFDTRDIFSPLEERIKDLKEKDVENTIEY